MNELKSYIAPTPDGTGLADYYLKSEADTAIAELKAENERLKEMMPKYEQFIKDEKFKKELVDEYDGYVYEWMGHSYIATPYINVFIKGILRALWLARAKRAEARKNYWYVRSIHEGDKELWSIDGSAVKYIGCIKRVNFDWLKIWSEVERKCRAKAEEQKA